MGQHSNGLRVMVVDDDASMRLMARMVLGLEPDVTLVGEAGDGMQAARVAEVQQPDGIILDWQMPGLDGLEVLPLLRAAAPDAAIVMWSADADDGLAARARDAGAAALVGKEPRYIALAAAVIRDAVSGAPALSS